MARLPLYLNILMAALTIAVAIYTITIKSQIAVDQRAISSLSRQIQSEEAMGEVLRAEWARLQRRDTIASLGIMRFGPSVGETAQEINVRDFADRNASSDGRAKARFLFQNAILDLPGASVAGLDMPALDPADHLMTDPDPIATCLRSGPCMWTQDQ